MTRRNTPPFAAVAAAVTVLVWGCDFVLDAGGRNCDAGGCVAANDGGNAGGGSAGGGSAGGGVAGGGGTGGAGGGGAPRPCNLRTQDCPTAQDTCYPYVYVGGMLGTVCRPAGMGLFGDTCRSQFPEDCARGLGCFLLSAGASTGECRQLCFALPCPPGFSCEMFGDPNVGVCK